MFVLEFASLLLLVMSGDDTDRFQYNYNIQSEPAFYGSTQISASFSSLVYEPVLQLNCFTLSLKLSSSAESSSC